MLRFSQTGNRINKFDLSPEERRWIKLLHKLAQGVLDYDVAAQDVLSVVHADVQKIQGDSRMVDDPDALNLDAMILKGIELEVGKRKLRKPTGQLTPDEHQFWAGVVSGCEETLDSRMDFIELLQALCHDTAVLEGFGWVYTAARIRSYLPVCQRWGKRAMVDVTQ